MAVTDRIEDLDDPTFNPYLADELISGTHPNPYGVLAELRAVAPVLEGSYRDQVEATPRPEVPHAHRFMVLSHAAVDEVLNDAVTFSNQAFAPTLGRAFGHTVSVMDPPEHTGYRKILQRAFRPPVVQQWGESIVGPVVEELVSAFRHTGRADLVDQFARPYPFNVIYRMLGLPAEDVETFYKLTIAQIVSYPTMDNALDASAKLGRYFQRMIDRRREDPGDDVVSVIATAEVDGELLPDEVAISFLRQLINAGGDTTFRTTTALLTGLLTNPEQLEAVRDDRSLVPQAIEEALRWDGPVLSSARLTTRDTEIQGIAVPNDSLLDVVYGSANRDPAVFADPDRYDIFRERGRHFGFAFGAHNCLGQMLARLEMSRALNALFDELPGLRLDPDEPTPSMRGSMMRTPGHLHVVFD